MQGDAIPYSDFIEYIIELLKKVNEIEINDIVKILSDKNIPSDARIMSDSGWEGDATDMDGVFYSRETNELVFNQGGIYEVIDYFLYTKKVLQKMGYFSKTYVKGEGWELVYDSSLSHYSEEKLIKEIEEGKKSLLERYAEKGLVE